MKVLLIPSAVLISKEMQQKFGKIPSALYPLNNIPMLEHIYEYYKNIVDHMYVLVNEKKELIYDYIRYKKLPIDVIEIDKKIDIGYSVNQALTQIINKNNVDYIYINFGDTLIGNLLSNNHENIIIYSNENITEEWTYFECQRGHIDAVIDKKELFYKEGQELEEKKVFVGVFGLKNPTRFVYYLSAALNNLDRSCDSFYQALLVYSQKENMIFEEAKEWFDLGHSDKYMKAKTGVEARSFNTISLDEARGILTKQSRNKEKFIDEISWYLKMPTKLQYLLPRIFGYSIDWEAPYISMEYYGYNTLHELYLYGNIPLFKWQSIFEKIKFIIDDMENYKILGHETEKIKAMEDIYIDKTIKRLCEVKKQKEFLDFFLKPITVNNKEYKSLEYYMNILPELLRERLINNYADDFAVIHGDLCFSNILMENVHGFMRLIDPRGRFGTFDIYGDTRYELAKLLHSIEGNYDFIIEDMFKVKVVNTTIEYSITTERNQIKKLFKDVFKERLKKYRDIQLIEAMLFLSMIPLHSNSLNRQYVMLATGLQLLEEATL